MNLGPLLQINISSGVTRLCDIPSCNERLADGELVARCPMCSVMAHIRERQLALKSAPHRGG